MKKSNITNMNKKHHNSPVEARSHLHLNKSISSFADLINLSPPHSHTLKSAYKEPKDLISTVTQTSKPRTNTKPPSKRLAFLLDTYSTQNNRKLHFTTDNIEGNSKDASLKSPHNTSEGSQKLVYPRHFGVGSSLDPTEFFKYREFSKIAMAKVLKKNSKKPMNQNNENMKSKGIGEILETQGLSTVRPHEESERVLLKDLTKKTLKTSLNEAEKVYKVRNGNTKEKIKQRKNRMGTTETSVTEKTVDSSMPQSTKHQFESCSSSMFIPSAISLRPKTTFNQYLAKEEKPMTALQRSRQFDNQRDELINSRSLHLESQERRRKETSSSITAKKGESVNKGANMQGIITDISKYHYKENSLSKGKQQQGNTGDRKAMYISSDMLRGGYYKPLPKGQLTEKANRGEKEKFLSWSTTRNGDDSEQREGVSLNIKHEEKVHLGLVSKDKLEKAFEAFLGDNKGYFDAKKEGFEKIAEAWKGFLNSIEEENREKVIVTDNKRSELFNKIQIKINGVSTSTNQSTLPTEKRLFKPESNLEKCDTEKTQVAREDLGQIVEKQRSVISALKRKEAKMMKLIYAIGKKGIDVEKIYKEEVKRNSTSSSLGPFETSSILKASSHNEEVNVSLPRENLGSNETSTKFKIHKSCSDTRNPADPEQILPGYVQNSQNRTNLGGKTIPKLDLTSLNSNNNGKLNSMGAGSSNGSKGFKLDLKSISGENASHDERPGFHEEFMSRIDEFSHSWRQEALNQRSLQEEEE